MKAHKFFIFLAVLLGIAAGYYFYSTDRTSDTVLIGIVDANQVIVSSKIMGRVEKLYVDEGSKVKAGDLIAEIDSAELEAQKNAAQCVRFDGPFLFFEGEIIGAAGHDQFFDQRRIANQLIGDIGAVLEDIGGAIHQIRVRA